jgi:hypothetical protein
MAQHAIAPSEDAWNLTIVSSDDTISSVSKHDHALAAIFAKPVRANVKWADIEALLIQKRLIHKGAELSEGAGSRVRVFLNGVVAVFHRPHPKPETGKGAVCPTFSP